MTLHSARLTPALESYEAAPERPTVEPDRAPRHSLGSDPLSHLSASSRRLIIITHDLLAVAGSLLAATALREGLAPSHAELAALLMQLPLLLIIAHLLFVGFGTYRSCWRYVTVADLAQLTLAASLTVLAFLAALFLWNRVEWVPRSVPLIQWLILVVALCGSRILYAALSPRWRHPAAAAPSSWHPVLLIGGSDGAALVMRLLEYEHSSYRVVGILDDRATIGRTIGQVPVLGRLADLERLLARLDLQGMRPERLIVTQPRHELGEGALREVTRQAAAAGIPVDQLPDLLRFRDHGWPAAQGAVPPIATVLRDVERRFYLSLKRLIDVAVSLALLVAAAPILVVIASGVWLTLGNPILFSQVRPGRGLARFTLHKFRTMRDSFDSRHRPLEDADRTPLLGRILRRTRLDELPQLLSVLKGDMSLIGPRPLLERQLAALPNVGRERAILRPGLTGWAQVNGGHQISLREKLALDLVYVRRASLAFDLAIAVRTVGVLLIGERVDQRAIAAAYREVADRNEASGAQRAAGDLGRAPIARAPLGRHQTGQPASAA